MRHHCPNMSFRDLDPKGIKAVGERGEIWGHGCWGLKKSAKNIMPKKKKSFFKPALPGPGDSALELWNWGSILGTPMVFVTSFLGSDDPFWTLRALHALGQCVRARLCAWAYLHVHKCVCVRSFLVPLGGP